MKDRQIDTQSLQQVITTLHSCRLTSDLHCFIWEDAQEIEKMEGILFLSCFQMNHLTVEDGGEKWLDCLVCLDCLDCLDYLSVWVSVLQSVLSRCYYDETPQEWGWNLSGCVELRVYGRCMLDSDKVEQRHLASQQALQQTGSLEYYHKHTHSLCIESNLGKNWVVWMKIKCWFCSDVINVMQNVLGLLSGTSCQESNTSLLSSSWLQTVQRHLEFNTLGVSKVLRIFSTAWVFVWRSVSGTSAWPLHCSPRS